jgi:RNA polymerase sigma-70 factor (ECF subfamily)
MGDQMTAAGTTDDREARFSHVYRSTRVEILAYLLRRASQREDAADLLGEVYLSAWRRIDDIPEGDSARLWLYGVARRVLANYHRRDRTVRKVAGVLRAELIASDVAVVDITDARIVAVHEALDALDPDHRELLTLTAWERLTPAGIARMTGEAPGTVRVRLHRARTQLRVELARLGVVVSEEPARLLAEVDRAG